MRKEYKNSRGMRWWYMFCEGVWYTVTFWFCFQFVSWLAILPCLLLAFCFHYKDMKGQGRQQGQQQQQTSWQPHVAQAMGYQQAQRNKKGGQVPPGAQTLYDEFAAIDWLLYDWEDDDSEEPGYHHV